jgi:hypothetical protein
MVIIIIIFKYILNSVCTYIRTVIIYNNIDQLEFMYIINSILINCSCHLPFVQLIYMLIHQLLYLHINNFIKLSNVFELTVMSFKFLITHRFVIHGLIFKNCYYSIYLRYSTFSIAICPV